MDLFMSKKSLIYFNNQLIWFHKNKLFLFSLTNNQQAEITLEDGLPESAIVSMNISVDGTITACSNNKSIYLVRIHQSSFEVIGQYLHTKRLNVSIFKPDTNELIIGDKFGDIYLIDISSIRSIASNSCETSSFDSGSDNENSLESRTIDSIIPKMGHLSTITCLITSSDSKFLFTGNKCGKIWVSNFKNLEQTFSILCGHSDAVSSICEISTTDRSCHLLISSSLDKKVKLWDYLYGTQVDSISLEFIPLEVKYSALMRKVFIKCEGLNGIVVLSLTLDEESKALRFQKKFIISLNNSPNSLEINDFSNESSFTVLENLVDIKNSEGCFIWYKSNNDLPELIVTYTKSSCYTSCEESEELNYRIVPDILKNVVIPKVNLSSQDLGTNNINLKKAKISD